MELEVLLFYKSSVTFVKYEIISSKFLYYFEEVDYIDSSLENFLLSIQEFSNLPHK